MSVSLIDVLNEIVVTFNHLCWERTDLCGRGEVHLERKTFIMMVFLSIPEELIANEKISLTEIEKILYQNFIEDADANNVKIVSYSSSQSRNDINTMFMPIYLLLNFEKWYGDEEKRNFKWLMLLYPFRAIMNDLYSSDPERRKVEFARFSGVKEEEIQIIQNAFDRQEKYEENQKEYLEKYEIELRPEERSSLQKLMIQGYWEIAEDKWGNQG